MKAVPKSLSCQREWLGRRQRGALSSDRAPARMRQCPRCQALHTGTSTSVRELWRTQEVRAAPTLQPQRSSQRAGGSAELRLNPATVRQPRPQERSSASAGSGGGGPGGRRHSPLTSPSPRPSLAGTMPWQLPEDVAMRVQRACLLLAESEEHRGSADLQASCPDGCGASICKPRCKKFDCLTVQPPNIHLALDLTMPSPATPSLSAALCGISSVERTAAPALAGRWWLCSTRHEHAPKAAGGAAQLGLG